MDESGRMVDTTGMIPLWLIGIVTDISLVDLIGIFEMNELKEQISRIKERTIRYV